MAAMTNSNSQLVPIQSRSRHAVIATLAFGRYDSDRRGGVCTATPSIHEAQARQNFRHRNMSKWDEIQGQNDRDNEKDDFGHQKRREGLERGLGEAEASRVCFEIFDVRCSREQYESLGREGTT